jgi:hypothetical protein
VVADLGQVLVGLLVAVIGFTVVMIVCAVLLALFQRILPGAPSQAGEGVGTDVAPAPADEQDPAPVTRP